MNATSRRINRGRGHSYEIDGQPVPGITTILSNGIPKPALIGWAANTTAGYAVDHWEELAELNVSRRLEALKGSRFAEKDAAANRGTEIHLLAQALAAGDEVTVPEELEGHIDAYLAFVKDWQPAEILIETPVYHRRLGYAGTPDLFATLNDQRVWLLDWKTGGKGIYPEYALQLAAARYAEYYIDDHGREQPVPAVASTGCVWLRADGYDLIPVQAGPDAFKVFLHAKAVAGFTSSERATWVGDTITNGR